MHVFANPVTNMHVDLPRCIHLTALTSWLSESSNKFSAFGRFSVSVGRFCSVLLHNNLTLRYKTHTIRIIVIKLRIMTSPNNFMPAGVESSCGADLVLEGLSSCVSPLPPPPRGIMNCALTKGPPLLMSLYPSDLDEK